MKKNSKTESLGTRLKSYEADYERRVEYNNHLIVRIDGHHFSKFTKQMKKPFDEIFSKSMEKTTIDLVERFGASIAYEQSDEISLVFPRQFQEILQPITTKELLGKLFYNDEMEYRFFDKQNKYIGFLDIDGETDERYTFIEASIITDDGDIVDKASNQERLSKTLKGVQPNKIEEMFDKYIIKEVHIKNNQIFDSRIQKLVSIISAFTTMSFNKHFSKLIPQVGFDEPKNYGFEDTHSAFLKYIDMMKSKIGNAYFDARVYGVDTDEEAFNSIMWRVRDCVKNSTSMFAQAYCSHKSLLNKNGQEQIDFCKETTGNDWEELEAKYKFGILVKKELYEKAVDKNQKTFHNRGTVQESVTRSRIITWSEQLTTFSDESVDIVMRKYK